jgi:hypothetical protein
LRFDSNFPIAVLWTRNWFGSRAVQTMLQPVATNTAKPRLWMVVTCLLLVAAGGANRWFPSKQAHLNSRPHSSGYATAPSWPVPSLDRLTRTSGQPVWKQENHGDPTSGGEPEDAPAPFGRSKLWSVIPAAPELRRGLPVDFLSVGRPRAPCQPAPSSSCV